MRVVPTYPVASTVSNLIKDWALKSKEFKPSMKFSGKKGSKATLSWDESLLEVSNTP